MVMDQVIRNQKIWITLLLGAIAGFAQAAHAAAGESPEIDAQFTQGMQALEDERLKSAIESFSNILNQDPSLNRVKLELALSYYRALRYEEAQELAKEVLDDPLTPPEVRVTVLAFLAQVKRDSELYGQKNQFTPHLSLGVMHDSNVNVGPTQANIRIGDIPATLTPSSLKKSGNAGVADIGINHIYQSGKRVELGQRTGMLVWQNSANIYWRKYHDFNDYDLLVASVNTGPAVLLLRHWRASLQLSTEFLDLGARALGWFHSVNPSITWQFNNAELNWDTLYTHRHYYTDADSGQEGDYVSTGLNFGRYFNNRRITTTMGARLSTFLADDDQYSYKSAEISAGISTKTYRNGSAYARGSYAYYNYDGDVPLFQKARQENEFRGAVGLTHEFNQPDDLLKGWVADLFWEGTHNNSNIGQLYSYERNQTMLMLSRNF
jgi:tetratricopeptide (TPR) repeat protein